jgi:hypothetical protein
MQRARACSGAVRKQRRIVLTQNSSHGVKKTISIANVRGDLSAFVALPT